MWDGKDICQFQTDLWVVFLGDARVIEVVVYWVYLNMEVRGTVLCGEFPWWTKFLDFKLMLLLSSMFFVVIMTWPEKIKRENKRFRFSSCCRHPSLLLQSADVLDVRPGHDQPDRRRPELQLGPEDAAVEDVQRNVRSGLIMGNVFVHFLVWLKCNYLTIHQNSLIRIYLDLIPCHDSSAKALLHNLSIILF